LTRRALRSTFRLGEFAVWPALILLFDTGDADERAGVAIAPSAKPVTARLTKERVGHYATQGLVPTGAQLRPGAV
jgi:hypothetical protein